MPIVHPPVTDAIAKLLYAHAFGCAFEGCGRPLYRIDNETGVRTLNSRICHINARSEGGPRWDPDQSAEHNRSVENLVLMCPEHAALIDIPETLSTYPVERLRAWKRAQLAQYDRIQQGWALDNDMARQAIEASLSRADVAITNSIVSLGGEGGKAPGAGGGGGGAIGRGARGGRGGDGGGHRIDEGDYTFPWPKDDPVHLDMEELAKLGVDFVPGAGGGGAGAIGDGAIGGNGGNGGECVSAVIDIARLREDGFHHVEFVVGKGGENGCDGEDTIARFMTEDGRCLKTLRAFGGKSGSARLPEGVVEIGPKDLQGHFRVTTFMVANAVEVRDGLFFVLGADWGNYTAPQLPFDAVWPVIYALRWNACKWTEPRGAFMSLLHPDGHEVACQALVFPMESGPGGCWRGAHPITAKLDTEGTWSICLHSRGYLLAQLEIPVVLPAQSTH